MNRTLLFTVLLAAAGIAQAHDHAGGDERGRSIDKVNGGITAQAARSSGLAKKLPSSIAASTRVRSW